VHYVIFDLLYLDGRSLMDLPYTERREQLAELGLNGPTWRSPANHVGDGEAMLQASRAQGLEGIIAKRLDCNYTAGRRSPGWVKVKNVRETDVVVGGWLPGEGKRSGRLGALVVGFYEDGELKYAGRVGTGFDEAELTRLGRLFEGLARDDSPFGGRQPPRETQFVDPVLIAHVGYGEWTQTRTLRHPRYLGLRDDIDPETVEFDDG
jgi:bifunctional non-homologous end joining protein LigD